MFSEYDYTDYNEKSIVKVKLNKTINNDPEFYDFICRWLNLYDIQKDFTFIFNAEEVGYVPIKYSFKMALFIKSLKTRNRQYLKKSIIIIKNKFARALLDLIFMIQSPVAPVYIIQDPNLVDNILNLDINQNNLNEHNLNKQITIISP